MLTSSAPAKKGRNASPERLNPKNGVRPENHCKQAAACRFSKRKPARKTIADS